MGSGSSVTPGTACIR